MGKPNTLTLKDIKALEITHAYVENFIETVELVKRKHVIRLELLQKEVFHEYRKR